MKCPPEIAEILLAILQTGLLRIRALAWSDDSRRCAVEADHLHNLPSLLTNYSVDLLQYYWNVERTSFMSQNAEEEAPGFEPHWKRLESYVVGERVAGLSA